jgi:hypothetical protein
MRSLAVAIVVVLGAGSTGPSSAEGASFKTIGQFTWEAGDPLFGPTFSFEYLVGELMPGLRVDLETSDGLASFAFNTSVGFDNDGDGIDDAFRSQIIEDLSGFSIVAAFIRTSNVALFLLDPITSTPLFDSPDAPAGLDGLNLVSAQVAIEVQTTPDPEPVPEPATLLLLALGAAGGLVRSRLQHRR